MSKRWIYDARSSSKPAISVRASSARSVTASDTDELVLLYADDGAATTKFKVVSSCCMLLPAMPLQMRVEAAKTTQQLQQEKPLQDCTQDV